MKLYNKQLADKLLKIKVIKLQPNNPFTWASGWKSPIYCDNRKHFLILKSGLISKFK